MTSMKTMHPDRRRDRSCARIDALPEAARRAAIPPAGRLLTLAFLEALVREDGHDILRRRRPAVLLFDPRDPAVRAKCIAARHRSHHAPRCVKIFELPRPTAETPGGIRRIPKLRA
jgi:hypothetical protein